MGVRWKNRGEFKLLFAMEFFGRVWSDVLFLGGEVKLCRIIFFLSPKCILDTVNLTPRSLKQLPRGSESYPIMCLRDVSKYYYGIIKKHSKEPFNIKIDNFQPGSMPVVLSCPTTWPGKPNKVCIFVQPHDLERPIRPTFCANTYSLNYI